MTLYGKSLAETKEWLEKQGAKLLGRDSRELPSGLRDVDGVGYLLPVAWREHTHIVLFLPPAFPDVEPRVFLPAEVRLSALLPHVSRSGQVCCLPPGVGVNPFKPVEVIESVLATARQLLERVYTAEELQLEILPELQAYWQSDDTPCWLVRSVLAGTHRLLDVQGIRSTTVSGLSVLAALGDRMEKHATVAIVIDLAIEDVLPFVHDPAAKLATLPSWSAGLAQLVDFARGHRGKRIRPGVLARCPLASGPVLLGGYFDQQLKVASHHAGGLVGAAEKLLRNAEFVRCDVQDIGHERLMRRTAGRPSIHTAHRLAGIGCGSLGGFMLDVIARHGLGALLVMDKEILHPANLSRHVLGASWLYRSKAVGVADRIRACAPDTSVEVEASDFRSRDALLHLKKFDPRLTLMATGDMNAELTLSRACAQGLVGACAFSWLEPNLSGAHLIFQPRGGSSIDDLHDLGADRRLRYRHRFVDRPEEKTLRESGCQTDFTPYSGADVAWFAAVAARQLLAWLETPPDRRVVLRWTSSTGWEECA